MLVLSRKQNQKIIIGGVVEITVTDIRLGRVVIAIKAHESITILRGELVEKIIQKEIQDGEKEVGEVSKRSA